MNIELVQSIMALVLLYFVIYFGLSSVFLESGRQKIFKIRDHLFDYSLDHPEKLTKESHDEIRLFINKSIVAMEYATLFRFIALSMLHRKDSATFDKVSELYNNINDERTKQLVKSSLKKIFATLVITMFLRSPVTTIVLFLFGLLLYLLDMAMPFSKSKKASIKSQWKNKVVDSIEHAY